jgi:hypothetical protein
MFTQAEILTDFASFAEASRDGWLRETIMAGGAYTFHHRDRLHSCVRRSRPEGLKDDVSEVVDERPTWTIVELCARLSLPTTAGTRQSLGKILRELGLKCLRGTDDVRVFRRSDFTATPEAALEAAAERDRWTTSELLTVLGWPVNRSTQITLGRVLAKGGWIRSRNPVASNRIAVYRRSVAPATATS